MPVETADTEPEPCIPTAIYTDVVRARVHQRGEVLRKVRVYKPVREIDFCAAEVVSARVSVGERGWEVSAVFRVTVGYDPGHRDRVLRTLVFYKTHVPLPHTTHPRPVDLRKLEARVKIEDIDCEAVTSETERVMVVTLRFRVVVYAMEDEVITVCRLPRREEG